MKNNVKSNENSMFILGANAAGLLNKLESFHRNISLFKPGVIFVQEIKVKVKIRLNCPSTLCLNWYGKIRVAKVFLQPFTNH